VTSTFAAAPSATSRTEADPAITDPVRVGIGGLSFAEVVRVARRDAPIELTPDALDEMARSAGVIAALASDTRPHYGVSTGFGALASKQIPFERRTQLQRSLVRSHAAGSGPEVEREVVRALMLLRLSTLATGRTGVRPVVAQTYAAVLNAGITPIVREYGSLGCSGDLAPLAHCALALMGEGDVRDVAGAVVPASVALRAEGIAPLELVEKEGLSLINGTDGMLGMLVLALTDLRRLVTTADLAAAMSVEGLRGVDSVFAADLQELRPHPGQRDSAANIRAVLDGSELLARPDGFARVQDAYSLRCAPQVHGGVRDTIDHAARVAERELSAAVDNPAVTIDGRAESNGNFHGAPIAYVLDFLAIVSADLASMSERRTDRFLDVARNHGLNAFLADDPGVDSGHMIAQYTQAAIVSDFERHAGGPRLDGMVGGAQAPPCGRRALARAGDRAADRRPRPRHARASAAGAGELRRRRAAAHGGRGAGRGSVSRARDLRGARHGRRRHAAGCGARRGRRARMTRMPRTGA